jgi:hypothetical protein
VRIALVYGDLHTITRGGIGTRPKFQLELGLLLVAARRRWSFEFGSPSAGFRSEEGGELGCR